MRRSDLAPAERVPFFVHVDEFQSFGTEAFAGLLSEARKFATRFCLANQYTEQLAPAVRAAVLGNAGAMLVFRVSGADAELLVPEFDPLPASELVDGRRSVRGCAAVSGMNMSNCYRGFIRRPAVSMQCGRRADGILDGREAL